MKPFISSAAVAIMAATLLAQPLPADSVTGSLGIAGDATLDTLSSATATCVTGWLNTQVLNASGTFATSSYALPDFTPVTFTTNTWNFNTSTPITNFWSAGGFNFELLASQIIAQAGTPGVNGFVIVNGSGIITGNGFTPTAFSWVFSCQDPMTGTSPNQWTFNAGCNGPLQLQSQATSNAIILTWPVGFNLQSAPDPVGPFTNIPAATSPYTNPFTCSQQFFRLSD